jgi:hypothetical protein
MEKPDFVLELEKQAASAVAKLKQDNFSKNILFMLGNMELIRILGWISIFDTSCLGEAQPL